MDKKQQKTLCEEVKELNGFTGKIINIMQDKHAKDIKHYKERNEALNIELEAVKKENKLMKKQLRKFGRLFDNYKNKGRK